jgi:hypothetical protein
MSCSRPLSLSSSPRLPNACTPPRYVCRRSSREPVRTIAFTLPHSAATANEEPTRSRSLSSHSSWSEHTTWRRRSRTTKRALRAAMGRRPPTQSGLPSLKKAMSASRVSWVGSCVRVSCLNSSERIGCRRLRACSTGNTCSSKRGKVSAPHCTRVSDLSTHRARVTNSSNGGRAAADCALRIKSKAVKQDVLPCANGPLKLFHVVPKSITVQVGDVALLRRHEPGKVFQQFHQRLRANTASCNLDQPLLHFLQFKDTVS